MTNKYILFRNLAIFCVAGNMVYWLFPFPAVVWRVVLVLLSFYVIFIEGGKLLPCEKIILAFTAFNLLHFVISYLWKNPSTTQIGNIVCALLPLSLFVRLSEKGVINDKFITLVGFVLLFLSILRYYHYERMVILAMIAGDDDTDITNNASVAFLMLLPMIFLMKNDIQKWFFLMVCIFFLVSGAKRGNILAAVIPIVLFVRSTLINSRHSALKTILVLVVIIGAAFITYRWVVTNEYLLYRIEKTEQGNSSGRDVIYTGAWHAWYDSEKMVTYLFGYGFDGTLQQELTRHHHAHNDWLEVLVDYGLLGFFLYLMVFIILALQIIRVKTFEIKIVLLSSVFIWFFKTLYSMGFTSEILSVLMISMGAVLGRYKTETQLI